MRKAKVFIPLMACLLMLTGCKNNDNPTSGRPSTPDISIDPTAFGGYYANYVDWLSVEGNELQFNLHKLCLLTHTKIVTYNQFSAYTTASTQPRSIDQSATDSTKNVAFYTGAEISKSQKYTREHVWPCANSSGLWVHSGYSSKEYYVDGTGYWGGGSDLYHVRPSSTYVNTARGNSKFIEFKEGEITYQAADDGTKSGSSYNYPGGKCVLLVNSDPDAGFATKSEPADQYKGDIVRILMYVYIHYAKMGGTEWNWYYDEAKTKCVMGSLGLRQVFGIEDQDEMYEMIVRWNELDPVDDHERLRNDTIQQIQGNRNPFVDYPDLVAKCFGL